MIIAANAAGVMPIGFIDSVAGFGDWEKFRRMVRRSRDFGFMGAGCIHPGQVTIVNEEYTPTAEEVEYACKVIALDRGPRPRGAIDIVCVSARPCIYLVEPSASLSVSVACSTGNQAGRT